MRKQDLVEDLVRDVLSGLMNARLRGRSSVCTIIPLTFPCFPFVSTYDPGGSGENWSATTSQCPDSLTRKNMSLPFIVMRCPAMVNDIENRYVTTAHAPVA